MPSVDFKEFMELVAHTGVSTSELTSYLSKDMCDIALTAGKAVPYTAAPVNPFGTTKILGRPKLPEPEIDIPF